MTVEPVRQRVHYFANGTEGRMWESAWCGQCKNDHAASHGGDFENGCHRLALIYLGEPHSDLEVCTEEAFDRAGVFAPYKAVKCSAFDPCKSCGVAQNYHPLDETTQP
jgi:hypothetical protein